MPKLWPLADWFRSAQRRDGCKHSRPYSLRAYAYGMRDIRRPRRRMYRILSGERQASRAADEVIEYGTRRYWHK
jgi:hypothetical protein